MIEALLALLFGLLIGSFLNVTIHRWPRGRSVVKPRSHCVRCRKTIAWYENVPLASYAQLRGRCRYCGRKISPRYPLVELACGLLFFYFVWTLGHTPAALKMCVFTAMLLALAFCDLEKRLLPDQFTLGGTLIGFVFAAFVPVPGYIARMVAAFSGYDLHGRAQWLAESALGALFPAAVLWIGGWLYLKIRHREGLGFGDVKLICMAGSFVGLQNALLILLVASFVGSVVGYGYIRITRQDASSYQLPFGSFLSLAGIAAAIAGKPLLDWYSVL